MTDGRRSREMADQRSRSSYALLSKAEFYNQKMHREEVSLDKPYEIKNPYGTVHKTDFLAHPGHKRDAPRFTVGRKNVLGTSKINSTVSLDQLRLGQIQLVDPDAKGTYGTTYQTHFSKPDLTDRFQGVSAPRGGIAPRMPYSEVERQFGSLDSTGTLPGERAFGGKFDTRSEYQSHFGHPGVQPKQQPEFTLRWSNELGTGTTATRVPPTMLNATHFDFGKYDGPLYDTTTASHFPRPSFPDPNAPVAGVETNHGVGPSAVERGFREPIDSRDYNIVTTRERLGGAHNNTEAFMAARVSAGRALQPGMLTVGLKQEPSVDPRARGPTGRRQSYDIITGVERPAERWGQGIAPIRDQRGMLNRKPDPELHERPPLPTVPSPQK